MGGLNQQPSAFSHQWTRSGWRSGPFYWNGKEQRPHFSQRTREMGQPVFLWSQVSAPENGSKDKTLYEQHDHS